MIRRSVFDAIGRYDETLDYEDWDMWLRIAQSFDFVFIDEPLAHYRIVSTSMQSTMLNRRTIARHRTQLLIFAKHVNSDRISAAQRRQIRARLADDAEAWFSPDGRVALGHRRLAIIDLSDAGAQPMHSADGRLTVVFNGEICNYQALREQLSAQGVVLRSHSNTEVLLHLYARHGEAMVEHLRGMYAFAIWDVATGTVFLARDPYGIKPLYYAAAAGALRFASQVKALLAGGAVSPAIEPAALAGFLVWGSVPEPFSFHRDIRMLPAGHTLRVDARGVGTPRKFWDLGEVILRSTQAATSVPAGSEAEVLREALRDAVRAHLVAVVPVGAFLSAELAPLTGDLGPEGLNDFGKVAYLEATRYMRNQLLRDSDWTGMAHSLEIRVPMVDSVLTERVIGLAASGRMRGGKAMLADLVPGALPPAILNRPKTGFSIPIWVWLRQSAAAAWKRSRFLARHNVGACSRWAYCVLASRPETAEALR